jgi:hypothetical protein
MLVPTQALICPVQDGSRPFQSEQLCDSLERLGEPENFGHFMHRERVVFPFAAAM